MSSAPRVIGRYLICEPIAAGGMATVHLARLLGPEGFSRTVAVKQLHAHYALDEEFSRMFLDEARLLARIRHPHVVSPLDIVPHQSELFIVMEYVHGEALSRLVKAAAAPVPPRLASAVMHQTLLGLHAAHEASDETGQPLAIVHRDVSPQNILVGADGWVRIVDFGIAKASSRAQSTQDGRLKGKLGYLAPEQLRLESTDRRTDVFLSGIVVWELLTGRRLYPSESPVPATESVLHGAVPAPSSLVPELPPALDEVVLRALALEPESRFSSAREMAAALAAVVPPADPLEVAGWVEHLVGEQLRRREERIQEIEGLSLDEFTLALPGRSLSRPGVSAHSGAMFAPSVAPEPPGKARRPAEHTDLSITPSSAHALQSPWRRKLRHHALALVATLVASLALGLAAFRLRPSSEEPSASPAPRAVGEAPQRSLALAEVPVITATAGSPAERSAEEPAAAEAEASERAGASEAAPAGSAPASPKTALPKSSRTSARARAAATRSAAPASAASASAAPVSAAPAPHLAPPVAAPPLRRKPADCEKMPYTVDAKGVRRYRRECF